jgi:phage major head subunit gpT-like protein
MAIEIVPETLLALNVSLIALYEEGLTDAEQEQSAILSCCYVGPSDSDANLYTMHTNQARLRAKPRGSDEFQVAGRKVYDYKIYNDRRYDAVEVHRDHLADDKVGQYASIFADLGRATALAPSQLVEQVILDGRTELCFDGVAFFATTHPVNPKQNGSATQSNLVINAAGLTIPNFETMYYTMEALLGEDGKTAGSRGNVLAVSPEYRGVGMDICYSNASRGYAGADNPWKGQVDLMVVQNWSGLGVAVLMDTKQNRRRPFIYQERQAFALQSMIAEDNPEVFKRDVFTYKVDGRDGAGYGYPTKAVMLAKS